MIEQASLNGLLRTLLIILLFYYGLKIVARIFAPILMQKVAQKMEQKFREQQQYQQPNATNQKQKTTPKPKKEVGEYIDYEEVD